MASTTNAAPASSRTASRAATRAMWRWVSCAHVYAAPDRVKWAKSCAPRNRFSSDLSRLRSATTSASPTAAASGSSAAAGSRYSYVLRSHVRCASNAGATRTRRSTRTSAGSASLTRPTQPSSAPAASAGSVTLSTLATACTPASVPARAHARGCTRAFRCASHDSSPASSVQAWPTARHSALHRRQRVGHVGALQPAVRVADVRNHERGALRRVLGRLRRQRVRRAQVLEERVPRGERSAAGCAGHIRGRGQDLRCHRDSL